MRASLRDALARGELIVCDGATATVLRAMRLPAGMMFA